MTPVRLSDDLDGALRAFFRAEMPTRWPRWAAPAAARPRRSWFASGRSRLALAASLALLVLGSLALAGALKPATPDSPLKSLGASASRPKAP